MHPQRNFVIVESEEARLRPDFYQDFGGMMKRTPDMKGSVIVIDVPNLKEHLKKIKKAGGRIIMPTQKVMDMGLYARIEDTEGNTIGVWQDLKK